MSPSALQWLAETYWWEAAKPRRLFQEEISHEVWRAVWYYGTTNSPAMREPGADPLHGRIWEHFLENGISGTRHQQKNFWRIGTWRTRSHEERRSLREVMMIQENSRYPESLWRTNGRTCKESGTDDWFRSTRNLTLSKKPYVTRASSTSPSWRQKNSSWNVRCSEIAVTAFFFRRVLTRTRSSTRAHFPKLPKLWTQWGATERPVTNWRTHDDVHDGKCSRNFRKGRQTIFSAQELAAALRNGVSQATTAFDSWKREVKKLTQAVADHSTKRIAGSNYLHSSVLPPPHQEWFVRNFFCRQKELIHHRRHRDPQKKANHGSMFHRPLLLCWTRDQLPMKVSPKEQELVEFEPWPQASKFNSWKVSLRREATIWINSSSTDQRLVSRNWFNS